MRIAIVHENWGAGAARCARDLEAAFRQKHDVLFFPRSGEPETADTVLAGLASFAPDVVNCHSFYGGLPYGILEKLSNRYPVCFTVHDPRPIGTMDPVCYTCDRNSTCLRCPMVPGRWRKLLKNQYFTARLRKRLCHLRCSRKLRIVTPSRWLADRLRGQELKRFRIDTIPNGIDLKRFEGGVTSRQRFGLPTDEVVLLHLAWHKGLWRPNEPKGLRYLAEAFCSHVLPQQASAVLAIAGEGLAPNHPNVRPLGMVDHADLPDLFASVDLFVTPTLADNFPYTVIEAMAAGKPVVASNVGGIPEQVVEGITGRLVPPGDANALGEVLAELLKDRAKMSAYGEAGRSRTQQLFGMEQFTSAYEQVLAELAEC